MARGRVVSWRRCVDGDDDIMYVCMHKCIQDNEGVSASEGIRQCLKVRQHMDNVHVRACVVCVLGVCLMCLVCVCVCVCVSCVCLVCLVCVCVCVCHACAWCAWCVCVCVCDY